MQEQWANHFPSDGPLGSFEETRAWQARLIFQRTTPAERLAMLEAMLAELGDDRVRAAIDRKLAERERRFIPPSSDDR